MARSSKELKRISRDILNNRYSVPMGAFLTASLIPAVIELPFSMSLGDYPSTTQLIIAGLAEFLIMLIAQVLTIGSQQVHLNMTRGKVYRIRDIFFPFRFGADRFFGSVLLYTLLMVFACIPAILGTASFYLTEISAFSIVLLTAGCAISVILTVALMLMYQFPFLFLLDYPQMKVRDAFKESRLLMKGKKKRLLYILFSFLGWDALVVCSFGIAGLWVSPYMTQTLITFYLDCTGELDRIPVRDYRNESKPLYNSIF